MASHASWHFRQRTLAFTTCLSVAEYLAARPQLQRHFCARRNEVRISPEAQLFFIEYADTLHFIALVNDALPETAVVVPVWARIAEMCPRCDLRILTDEGDPAALEAMINDPDALADLDGAELPQLLVFDDDWQLQARWGPRPPAADALLDEWLALHPEFEALADATSPEAQRSLAELNRALTQEMRVWYNSGLDRECVQNVQSLLAALQDEGEDEGGEEGEGGDR